jgi:hypothetical protein
MSNSKVLFVGILFIFAAIAYSHAGGYEARITCPHTRDSVHSYNFSADDDLAAQNEVRRVLRNRSDFAGKGCQAIEINPWRGGKAEAIKPRTSNTRTSYEARISCPQNKNSILSTSFFADSDIDAQNEVSRLLRSRTDFAGKGCQLVELSRR